MESVIEPLPEMASLEAETKENKSSNDAPKEPRHSLSTLLRYLGTAVLLAASGTFLAQQWHGYSDVERYLSFLGFTIILTAAGFFCGLTIREDKGARTFLAIAAGIIPIHFCQLGALIYSRTHETLSSIGAKGVFLWQAPSDLAAGATLAVALVVLVPIALIAFTALYRAQAKALAVVYVGCSALLLLPFRASGVSGFLLVAMILVISRFEVAVLRDLSASKTPEGRLVRTMMWSPAALLLGRTLNLYYADLDAVFGLALCAAATVTFLDYLPPYLKSIAAKQLAQRLSMVPLLAAGQFAFQAFFLPHHFSSEIALALRILPSAFALIALSFYREEVVAQTFRKAAALLAILSATVELALYPGVGTSLFCLVVSIVTLGYGYERQNLFVALIGGSGVFFGLGYQVRYALQLATFSPWLSLAVVGVITIIASSYIERTQGKLVERLSSFKKELATWK